GHHQWRFCTFPRDLAAWFAEEHDDQQAHNVKGRQKRCEQTYDKDWRVALIGERQNCVLAEKSAERRATDQRQRTNRESHKCDREASGKPAHFPNVLLVMKHYDDRAGGEKEESLKKSVGKKVENGRLV